MQQSLTDRKTVSTRSACHRTLLSSDTSCLTASLLVDLDDTSPAAPAAPAPAPAAAATAGTRHSCGAATVAPAPSTVPPPRSASGAPRAQQQRQQQQQVQQQQQGGGRSYRTEDSELDADCDSDSESAASSRQFVPTAEHLTGGLAPFLQDLLHDIMQPDSQEPDTSGAQALIRELLEAELRAAGVADASVKLEYPLTKPGALLVTVDVYTKVGRIRVVVEYDCRHHYMVGYLTAAQRQQLADLGSTAAGIVAAETPSGRAEAAAAAAAAARAAAAVVAAGAAPAAAGAAAAAAALAAGQAGGAQPAAQQRTLLYFRNGTTEARNYLLLNHGYHMGAVPFFAVNRKSKEEVARYLRQEVLKGLFSRLHARQQRMHMRKAQRAAPEAGNHFAFLAKSSLYKRRVPGG